MGEAHPFGAITVDVSLTEVEARLLPGLVEAGLDHVALTQEQNRIVTGMAEKFIDAANRTKEAIVEMYGEEEAERLAGEWLAMHPEGDLA